MATWEKVQTILKTSSTTKAAPHPGDPTALIPHTLISVLRRLRDARIALSEVQGQVTEGEAEKKLQYTRPSAIREVSSAIQELHRHFETVLSRKEQLHNALCGYKEGSVVWVDPRAQQDFVSFISALWDQRGSSRCSRQDLSELVEWALKADIDDLLDHTGVEGASKACRSAQDAFDVFQLALNKMLEVSEELSDHERVAVN